jgi:hypothetical protein
MIKHGESFKVINKFISLALLPHKMDHQAGRVAGVALGISFLLYYHYFPFVGKFFVLPLASKLKPCCYIVGWEPDKN